MPHAAGIHYRVHHPQGETLPLVLVHGAGGNLWHWPPEIRHLEGVPVYALDLPGHGDSPGGGENTIAGYAQAVIAWMEALDLPPVCLTGHSMGGAIALQVALTAPKRVRALGLIGTGARLRVSPKILGDAATPQGFPSAVDTIIQWAFHPQSDAALKASARERMLQISHTVLHGDFAACNAFDVRPSLEEIHAPALVVCGEADKMTPPKFAHFLDSNLPESRLVLIPRAGHMVMLERPQMVAATLRAFLEDVAPS